MQQRRQQHAHAKTDKNSKKTDIKNRNHNQKWLFKKVMMKARAVKLCQSESTCDGVFDMCTLPHTVTHTLTRSKLGVTNQNRVIKKCTYLADDIRKVTLENSVVCHHTHTRQRVCKGVRGARVRAISRPSPLAACPHTPPHFLLESIFEVKAYRYCCLHRFDFAR